jgi:hypothetical protein
MGFKTQRMANAFPSWTKLRKDPSSVGQKMFSVFSEMLEEHLITSVKLREDQHLLKNHLGVGSIYGISLDDADLYPTSGTDFGVTKYTFPTVVGTASSVPYTCTRAIELVEFLNAPPDRLVGKAVSLTVVRSALLALLLLRMQILSLQKDFALSFLAVHFTAGHRQGKIESTLVDILFLSKAQMKTIFLLVST